MTINDDLLAFFRSALGATDGAISDLEHRWLKSQLNSQYWGSTPDMWRQYLINQGYEAPDGMFLLSYPLVRGAGNNSGTVTAPTGAPPNLARIIGANKYRVTKNFKYRIASFPSNLALLTPISDQYYYGNSSPQIVSPIPIQVHNTG